MLQEPRGVFLGASGVNILANHNSHQGTEVRSRRVGEGHSGKQNLRVRLGYGSGIP